MTDKTEMKIKTDELIGTQLDWAVATCEGYSHWFHQLKFSSDWALAGPIIEREGIATRAIRPVSGDNGYIFTRRWIAEMFRFPGGAAKVRSLWHYAAYCRNASLRFFPSRR